MKDFKLTWPSVCLHRATKNSLHPVFESQRPDVRESTVHSAVHSWGRRARGKAGGDLLQGTDGAGWAPLQQDRREDSSERELQSARRSLQRGQWKPVLVWGKAGTGAFRATAASSREVTEHHSDSPLWANFELNITTKMFCTLIAFYVSELHKVM